MLLLVHATDFLQPSFLPSFLPATACPHPSAVPLPARPFFSCAAPLLSTTRASFLAFILLPKPIALSNFLYFACIQILFLHLFFFYFHQLALRDHGFTFEIMVSLPVLSPCRSRSRLLSWTLLLSLFLTVALATALDGNAADRGFWHEDGPALPRAPMSVRRAPLLSDDQIWPEGPYPPINSSFNALQELYAWTELTPFVALINLDFPLARVLSSTEQGKHTVFAPTAGAILSFADSILACMSWSHGNGSTILNNDYLESLYRNFSHSNRTDDWALPSFEENGAGTDYNSSLDNLSMNDSLLDNILAILPPPDSLQSIMGHVAEILEHVLSSMGNTFHLLSWILHHHIVAGDWDERTLPSVKHLITYANETLDVSEYPHSIGVSVYSHDASKDYSSMPNHSATQHMHAAKRVYRQIRTSNGRIAVIDKVLLPFSPKELCRIVADSEPNLPLPSSSPEADDSTLERYEVKSRVRQVEDGEEDIAPTPAVTHQHTPYADPEQSPEDMNPFPRLPVVTPVNPFLSVRFLVFWRTDMRVFNALLSAAPRASQVLNRLSPDYPIHLLAPTDTAFVHMAEKLVPQASELISSAVRDSSSAEKFVERLIEIWNSVGSLPSLDDMILYHAVPYGEPLEKLQARAAASGGGLATLATRSNNGSMVGMDNDHATTDENGKDVGIYNARLFFENGLIDDEDASRGPAMAAATYPTRTGFVSVIDSVLTSFDTEVASFVISTALNSYDDEDAESRLGATGEPDGSETSCFPGDALVTLASGERVEMKRLSAGDLVQSENEDGEDVVIAFTHKDAYTMSEFIEVGMHDGGRALTLTRGHYVYVGKQLVAAGRLRAGDVLQGGNGRQRVITSVKTVWKMGLFNPHSRSGRMVVDDVRVSCYSTAVAPNAAHALLAPVRAAAAAITEPLGSALYNGAAAMAQSLPNGQLLYAA